MYNADGKVVWSAELDAYGDLRELMGERTDCPFRYQGQYEDRETGLYYNRFRYYSVEEGMYLCQDPIGLNESINLYGYVANLETWIDPLGLKRLPRSDGEWMGEEGNSVWKSSNSDVEKATDNKGVRFKNGYPDFSPYSDKRYNFDDLDGTDKDFNKVYKKIKKEKGFRNQKEAKKWLRDNGLTPHHHQNGKTILLVPTIIHGNVPHEGGASKLRKKNC